MKVQPHITILVCAVLFTVLSSTSCKDKQTGGTPQPCTTCQSVLEAKDYFYFKMGSWWVYEEATTHQRDSMYVTLSQNDPNSYYFKTHIKSSLTDYEYRYWPVYNSGGGNGGCSPNGNVNKHCIYIKESKGKFQDLVGESNCFFISYKTGDFVGAFNVDFSNNKVFISDILDSFQVNGYNFLKTIKTHELAKAQDNNQPTYYYYSKGVGIVRKELLDSNQVWNLVNYHIQE